MRIFSKLSSALVIAAGLLFGGQAQAACPAGNTGPCEPWSTFIFGASDISTLTDGARIGLATAAGTAKFTTGLEILNYLSAKNWTPTGTWAGGSWTISGGVTFTGVPIMSGLSAGTIISGGFIGLDSGNHLVLGAGGGATFANPSGTGGPTANNGSATTAMRSDATFAIQKGSSSVFGLMECDGTSVTCPGGVLSATGGGGSIAVSDGTTTVTGVTALTLAGDVCSGTTPNASCAATVVEPAAKTANYSVLFGDMGNASNLGGTGSTLTLVAKATGPNIWQPGQTYTFTSTASGNWTLTNSSTLTTNLTSPIVPGTNGTLVANADTSHLDFFGLQAPSATAIGGVFSSTAPSNQFANGVSTGGAVTYAQPAFTNLSGSVAASQMPALTGDVTTSAGAVATTITANAVTTAKINNAAVTYAKVQNGASNGLLGVNSGGAPTEVAIGANLTLSGGTLSASGGTVKQILSYNSGLVATTANTTQYVGGGITLTEANILLTTPLAGTFKNMYVNASAAAGAGQSYTLTFRVNGSSTTITCSISGASATQCSDLTHSGVITAGQTYDLQVVSSVTAALSSIGFGIEFDPGSTACSTGALDFSNACNSSLLGVIL